MKQKIKNTNERKTVSKGEYLQTLKSLIKKKLQVSEIRIEKTFHNSGC